MWIDADTHIFPKEVLDRVPRFKDGLSLFVDPSGKEWLKGPQGTMRHYGPIYYSMKIRLDSMRDAGFEKQVVLSQNFISLPMASLETSKALCHAYNEELAKLASQYEEIIPIAEVPHQDPQAAVEELEYAVKDLGLKGVRVLGSWNGKNLNSIDYLPFFEKLEELGVPLFVHHLSYLAKGISNPINIARERVDRIGGSLAIGFMLEAIMAVSCLTLGGILEKFRGIKVVMNESGASWVPGLMARLDHGFEMINKGIDKYGGTNMEGGFDKYQITRFPSDQIREHFVFCVDTAGDVQGVPFMVKDMGMEDNLATQTDFPHPEGSNDMLRMLHELDIPDGAKDKILGGNVGRLLHVN